jgi:hypothetical protein
VRDVIYFPCLAETHPNPLSEADAALDYQTRLASFHVILYSMLVAGDYWSSSLSRRISRAFPIRVLASSLIGSFFAVLQLANAKVVAVAIIPNMIDTFRALVSFLFSLGGDYKMIVSLYKDNMQVLDELQLVLVAGIESGFYLSIIFLCLSQVRWPVCDLLSPSSVLSLTRQTFISFHLYAQVRMLRSFRRDVLRSLYWQQRTKFPAITTLHESEAVL